MRALGARLSHVREISLSLLLAGRSESELSGSAEFVGNSRRSYPRFSRPGSASHPCAPLRVYGRSAGWGLLSGGWKPAPNSHLSQEMFVICLLPYPCIYTSNSHSFVVSSYISQTSSALHGHTSGSPVMGVYVPRHFLSLNPFFLLRGAAAWSVRRRCLKHNTNVFLKSVEIPCLGSQWSVSVTPHCPSFLSP